MEQFLCNWTGYVVRANGAATTPSWPDRWLAFQLILGVYDAEEHQNRGDHRDAHHGALARQEGRSVAQ